jgi:hypothetical protein
MARDKKIAIVTVHGTGDTADSEEGQKWYQRGSAFTERLRQALAAEGFDADIEPVLWSGANSASEREKGAEKLAKALRRCRGRYESVHVIGHSHGGNVANEAAIYLRWGQKRAKQSFHSLVTVGTPFFNVRTGWLQRLAGLLFLFITYGSLVAVPLLGIGMWTVPELRAHPVAILSLLAVFTASALYMLAISRRGARRISRPRARLETSHPILAIWHENDEAISFLRRVEDLPIEPFPRGSMYRGSRTAAISWGVFAVIASGLAAPLMYMFGWADVFGIDTTASAGRAADVFAAMLAGLVFAPIIFVAVYWLYRWIIGGVAEIGARKPINGMVSGALRGMAMGRDGDQVICNVSTESHTHSTESRKLDGEVARRMQASAGVAADKLIEKYRWSLFTVGADSNAPLTDLATDAMTWDSLIHTTYFDQPEVADIIAIHIAARAKAA